MEEIHESTHFCILGEDYYELKLWLKEIIKEDLHEYCIVRHDKKDVVRINLFTYNYMYAIIARLPVKGGDKLRSPDDSGYLGCCATSRKPLAGETWARGNDLADGTYTRETWQRIICDILRYELVKPVKTCTPKCI